MKPGGMTTFWTTLSFRDEMGNVLLLGEATKVPCPLQLIWSDSVRQTSFEYFEIKPALSSGTERNFFDFDLQYALQLLFFHILQYRC